MAEARDGSREKPSRPVPAGEVETGTPVRCQVCGARQLPSRPALCHICGEPVLVWGWAP